MFKFVYSEWSESIKILNEDGEQIICYDSCDEPTVEETFEIFKIDGYKIVEEEKQEDNPYYIPMCSILNENGEKVLSYGKFSAPCVEEILDAVGIKYEQKNVDCYSEENEYRILEKVDDMIVVAEICSEVWKEETEKLLENINNGQNASFDSWEKANDELLDAINQLKNFIDGIKQETY